MQHETKLCQSTTNLNTINAVEALKTLDAINMPITDLENSANQPSSRKMKFAEIKTMIIKGITRKTFLRLCEASKIKNILNTWLLLDKFLTTVKNNQDFKSKQSIIESALFACESDYDIYMCIYYLCTN